MIKLFRFAAVLFLVGSALALPDGRRTGAFRRPMIERQFTGSASAKASCNATQSAAQDSRGNVEKARGAYPTETDSPTVTVTDHKMTGISPANDCTAPPAKTNFAATDTQATQWTLVSGANIGDVARWEFVQPNGTIYFQTSSQPLTFSGNVCFSAFIFIAGQAAASAPGAWQTRVFYNNVLQFTENFTIGVSGAVTITDRRMTGTTPANDCAPPPVKINFAPTDQTAYLWVTATGANAGDVARWEFVQPNGAVYAQSQFTLSFSGSVCFWSGINIAGQQAASLLGNWQARLFYNNARLLTESFTISANACPTIAGLSPASGAVGSVVTINGSNFSGVSAVKFNNNIAAQFTVVSATQITATAPSGAVTGAITVSKPNCADVQTPVFTVTQPVIDVTPASLGFGSVRAGQAKDLQLTVRNTGSATLTVSSITSSNAQFSVNSPTGSFNVAAGASAIVSVRFAPNSSGAKTGTLSINSNDPSRGRVDVAMTGTGLAPVIEVAPPSLNFGNVGVGESLSLRLTVRNTGNAPLNISSITSSDSQFTISLLTTSFALPANTSVNISVRFAPTSAGAKTGTLSINSNDPTRPRVDAPMTGTGLAPVIDVAPGALNFGQVQLAQAKDLVLTIRNTGGASLKISSITSSNAQFGFTQFIEKPSNAPRNLPLSIAPNTSVEVTVRFRPSFVAASIGALTGALTINCNDPSRPRVDVPLSGTGLGPLITAPSSLSFGGLTVCLATPNTANLTLTNTGNAPLTIFSAYADNSMFALTPRPAFPLTVQPGAGVTFTLSFYTRSTGSQSGRLIVSSNAVNNPGLNVSLSGVGAPIQEPAIGQLVASRTTMSHGRADTTRPISPFNPFGLIVVNGFSFPGAPLPANSISPGALPLSLINDIPALGPLGAIPSAPDPFHITLAGGVANPITLSAANIPSCFTLVVAEGVTAPNTTRWERIGTRFGSGNLYASVSIPGTGIFAGKELVTEAELDAYTANSIIFESPDFGLLVAPAGQNGGAVPLQARARRIPADAQCQALFSQSQSTSVEFSRTVRIEILSDQFRVTRNGAGFRVEVAAQIFGNFDPAINTIVRFAFDGNDVDIINDVPDPSAPGAARIIRHVFNVPASEECRLARITAVASSTGNVPAALLPPINPFLDPAPDSIGLFTFRSGGCTVEDVKSVLVKVNDSNCNGGVPSGWIQGVVTDAATGEPIFGATVSVVGQSISATTGFDGSYILNNVPAGPQIVNASASGFTTSQSQVTVTSNQAVTRDFALSPFVGAIRGVVLNASNSQPIAGATVSVKGTNIAATTGGDGSYTLSDVPVGSQTVDVSAPNFNSTQEIVTVVADQTNIRDYFLTPKVGAVRGIVRSAASNQPIPGATVSIGNASTTTDGTGAYTLNNILVGAQTVSASAPNFNPASVSVNVLAGQTVNQDIALAPQLGVIAGTVKDNYLQPIAGATVTAAGISTTTGADGAYTLNNIPAGAQTANASANNFRPASATVAVFGNQTAQQDFTLDQVTGAIKGRITDAVTNQPIANADVDLLPFPLSFGASDAGGNYTMNDVPTGQQVILASARGYYAKIAVVNVVANQTSTQDFALTPQVGTVTGVVYDSFSQPVVGATLSVAGTNITGTSSSDGSYTLSNVSVGAQTINVSVPGLRSATVTVNVAANDTIYKDIYLETPVGAVRGTVRNAANNQPIAGASILVGIPFGAVYYSAFTDGAGNYALNDVKAGSITIYVGADGFTPAQATVTVVANQTTTQNFLLAPDTTTTTGAITGVVRNSANNQPVSGATITVVGTNLSASSGGDGSYTISNIPSGAQTLNVSKTGFRTATVQVSVTGGQTVTQDISLAPGAGTVTGTVRNAANADPIVGATITVAGTNISTTSGAGGTYTLSNVPSGAQTLSASANGFIATQVQVNVTDNQTLTQNISLSPTLPQGEIRITLNWSKDGAGHPDDLDAHLIGPNPDGTCFEVSYTNLGNLSSPPFARLEVDNIGVSGHPPIETVRIAKLSPGIYRFYVLNYSNEEPSGLSGSRATVQIFGSGGQMGSFTAPSGSGRFWTVFEINGQTGAVTSINQLVSPATNCK
jgi:hypothetical protein